MEEKKCPKCGEGVADESGTPCPYVQELDDEDYDCGCCDACRQSCADDI